MANISAIKLPNGDIFDLVDEKSGYIAVETDPLFSASAAAGITSSDISNWNAKVSDDKTWNGVELDTVGTTYGRSSFIPGRSSTSATTAYQIEATTTPNSYRIAKWDNNKYLYSTTPSANDNSTKVATTAYVDGAVSGISVPTKTSDLTNDSGFITSYTDEKLKTNTNYSTDGTEYSLIFGNNTTNAETKYYSEGLRFSEYHVDTIHNASLSLGKSNLKGILLLHDGTNNVNNSVQIYSDTLTQHQSIMLPNKSGTVALTSDIPPIPLIPTDLSDLNNDLNVSDFPNDAGYITGYTETDPIFTASAAYGISASDITNWNGKQAALVSGTNIKTINNTSILGSGNISIVASGTSIPTADTVAEFDNDAHMNSTDMTSQEVEDFVDGLNVTASTLVDYIVEQGTSDIWTYRKWNSGIAECWGITAETTLSFSAWGDMYEAKVCDAVPFPTNLYITVPTVVANVIPTSGYAIMSTEFTAGGVTTSQIPTLYAIRPNTASGITARAHIHVIGRWK